ncbi:hypothetical protein GOV08_01685 [Candidatus Woesearchaeota archaeon]|nr:hypothetical protein [Candidatus Woesearchaeota archaeon]
MLTKNQIKIMELFTSQITELFTMRSIERLLKMQFSLVQYAIKPLKEKKLITLNKQNLLSLNYQENHDVLSYIEYIRRNKFLSKPKNKVLAMFIKDFVKNFKEQSFVLLIFGSAVNSDKPNDIDILLIVDDIKKTDPSEKFLYNTSRNYSIGKELHITTISYESVYEMLAKREKMNVINEVLNNHLIIYGAEIFYRLLAGGRE